MPKRTKGTGSDQQEAAAKHPDSEQRIKAKAQTNRITAMSHPLRARILRLLSDRDVMSPAQLSRELQAELSDVSYHVRALVKLECAEEVFSRPVRGAVEHFYRATQRSLIDTDEFEDLDPVVAEDLVCQAVQLILDDFVDSRKAEMVGFDKHFHITRTPLILDREGYEEGMQAFERCRLEMSKIEAKSAERRAESNAPGIATSANFLLFKVPGSSFYN